MKRLRMQSPADLDYLQAVCHYEEQKPGLGREFELELQTLFERIKRTPEFFSKATVTVRKARMPRFKYGVYFTIEADEIAVLAIYHPSRDPHSLCSRLI